MTDIGQCDFASTVHEMEDQILRGTPATPAEPKPHLCDRSLDRIS
jgi:hypothetical protein